MSGPSGRCAICRKGFRRGQLFFDHELDERSIHDVVNAAKGIPAAPARRLPTLAVGAAGRPADPAAIVSAGGQ